MQQQQGPSLTITLLHKLFLYAPPFPTASLRTEPSLSLQMILADDPPQQWLQTEDSSQLFPVCSDAAVSCRHMALHKIVWEFKVSRRSPIQLLAEPNLA